MKEHYDVIIVGTGAAGLYCALNLPEKMKILLITKQEADQSDSFLAQGGICMLRGEDDYENYFEDTMRAGHYENNKRAVDLMIRSSNDIIRDLLRYHVDFARDGLGNLAFTREGAHSQPRILFHEDITGKEITSKLLAQVKQLSNVTLLEYTTMTDIIVENDEWETLDIRALLNFGHTIGHGIEAAVPYGTILHGEAVALGMRAALFLSERKAGLSSSDANKILRTLQALELPLVLPDGIDTATVLQKTASDKKFRAGTIRFVLLSKAGEAGISTKITREDMAEAIEELRRPLD